MLICTSLLLTWKHEEATNCFDLIKNPGFTANTFTSWFPLKRFEMVIALPLLKYCLPSITTWYFFDEVRVTMGFLSAANMATVNIKPKARVKIFFILFKFYCCSAEPPGELQGLFFIPV